MLLPDTLSCASRDSTVQESEDFDQIAVLEYVSISDTRYTELKELTERELGALKRVILGGWPAAHHKVDPSTRPFWNSRDELTVVDDVIYKGSRIVVPPSMRRRMLDAIHESHMGMVKCKQRAREVVYWPGISNHIENMVRDCEQCADFKRKLPAEPLIPTPCPDLPWVLLGTDLFEFEDKLYIIMVDYCTNYIEADELKDYRCSTSLEKLKTYFRKRLPEELRCDNGSMFNAAPLREFCGRYDIKLTTSSPRYPRSNGKVEKAVQTVKGLWKKGVDKQMALLEYNSTPLEGIDKSPAQLLMGRRRRNNLPAARSLLKPQLLDQAAVKAHFDSQAQKQKYYHDRRALPKQLPPLVSNQPVRIQPTIGSKRWVPGTVVSRTREPRSYLVQSGDTGNVLRRNRRHLQSSTAQANAARGRRVIQSTPPEQDTASVPEPTPAEGPVSYADIVRGRQVIQNSLPEQDITTVPEPVGSPLTLMAPHVVSDVAGPPVRVTRSGRTVCVPNKLDL